MAGVSANRLELLQIADAVAREKSIDRAIVIEAMEDAIQKAARSRYGQETDIEAEAQPLEKYRWMPWSEFGDPNPSQVQAGSVIENAGASYYVADDGMRYWIRTTDAWFCARDAGSRMIGAVEGRVLLQFAIGGEYICGG